MKEKTIIMVYFIAIYFFAMVGLFNFLSWLI